MEERKFFLLWYKLQKFIYKIASNSAKIGGGNYGRRNGKRKRVGGR